MKNCEGQVVKYIVIPLVDASSIQNPDNEKVFVSLLGEMESDINSFSCGLSLETDFDPARFARLLDKMPSGLCTVNYDTGNSASLGFDMRQEFASYGELISDLHIKDRKYLGGPTLLGDGDVNFHLLKELLAEYDYEGPLIFQAYRDDAGVEIFKNQLEYFIRA